MQTKVLEPNQQLRQQSNNGMELKGKLLLLQKLSFQLEILDLTKKRSSIKQTLKIVVWKSQQVVKKHKAALSLKRLKTRAMEKKAMVSPLKMELSL